MPRDVAHARLTERLDAGHDLPRYFKDHPVCCAGPAFILVDDKGNDFFQQLK